MTDDVRVVDDTVALHAAAAEFFVDRAANAVRRDGRFTVALAGGATPNGVYAMLAMKSFRTRVSWDSVHVFWGDERCVGPDDARSNYRAAYELLLSHVPIPPSHVHRIRGEDDPAAAAHAYESVLRTHFSTPSGPPRFSDGARFDLVMLGLGTDGHTASLFPDHRAMREQSRWVVAEYAKTPAMWRVTMTPAVLNAAAEVLFLVAGEEKRGALADVMRERSATGRTVGDAVHVRLPAALIRPLGGNAQWIVDVAAAPRRR